MAGVYIATIAGGFLLLAASVVVELFMPPDVELEGPVISATNPDPAQLLDCNRRVQRLYDQLGDVTAELMTAPRGKEERNLGREWRTFGQRWVHDWHVVDRQCRFRELSGSMGEPYDRMARVHEDLRAERLKYQSLLVTFDEEQADELRQMQRALDRSRVALEALVEEAGGAAGERRAQ